MLLAFSMRSRVLCVCLRGNKPGSLSSVQSKALDILTLGGSLASKKNGPRVSLPSFSSLSHHPPCPASSDDGFSIQAVRTEAISPLVPKSPIS